MSGPGSTQSRGDEGTVEYVPPEQSAVDSTLEKVGDYIYNFSDKGEPDRGDFIDSALTDFGNQFMDWQHRFFGTNKDPENP